VLRFSQCISPLFFGNDVDFVLRKGTTVSKQVFFLSLVSLFSRLFFFLFFDQQLPAESVKMFSPVLSQAHQLSQQH
jgi:hypothetical protein